MFKFPDFHNCHDIHTADISDAKHIFETESGLPARIAYKLNKRVLNPQSLEKTNVSLAASLFDESTIAAAQHYNSSNGFIIFCKLINRLWTIWNIKSPSKGKHKRLPDANPIQKNDYRIRLLQQYADFFDKWENSKLPGLSKPTFFCSETMLQNFGRSDNFFD